MVKHLLAITITLLPSAVLAQQFTPQQMLDVMTKSPENRDVKVHDPTTVVPYHNFVHYSGHGAFNNGEITNTGSQPLTRDQVRATHFLGD